MLDLLFFLTSSCHPKIARPKDSSIHLHLIQFWSSEKEGNVMQYSFYVMYLGGLFLKATEYLYKFASSTHSLIYGSVSSGTSSTLKMHTGLFLDSRSGDDQRNMVQMQINRFLSENKVYLKQRIIFSPVHFMSTFTTFINLLIF